MCRWFAYISPSEPCLLEDVLVTPAHSLAKQVHEHYLPKLFAHDPHSPELTTAEEITQRNRFANIDGMGIVWYTSTRSEFVAPNGPKSYGAYPVSYKSLRHPLADPSFLSLSAHTSTTALLAHIRAAIPSPLQPIPTLTEFNCHPFSHGRYSLMHNGTVGDFARIGREIRALMGEEETRWVKGNTDSEALAGVFFTYLDEETRGSVSAAAENLATHDRTLALPVLKRVLVRTITAILDTQRRITSEKMIPLTPSSLNVAITDGELLICCRFRNHATQQPPSLYFSTTAGVTLNRKFPGHPNGEQAAYGDRVAPHHLQEGPQTKPAEHHGVHVIVASEPSTYNQDEWELVRKNECIMVGRDGSLTREPLGVKF